MTDNKPKNRQKKYIILAVGFVAIVLAVVLAVVYLPNLLNPRAPDQTAFCDYVKGNKLPEDWKERVTYFKSLERIAPDDIYQQIRTVREAYERMISDPSGAMAISQSVSGSIQDVNNWINTKCYSQETKSSQDILNNYLNSVGY